MQNACHRVRGLRSILMPLLLLVLVSCTTPGGRNAGQVCDDVVIASSIKARLTEMMGLSAMGVDVDVFQGEVVLQGRVHTPNQESRVIAVAARTPGVKKVVNLLQVIP